MTKEQLLQMAITAKQNAYAPYSDFKVGAAVLTGSGKVYCGCNIENASYGLTCCAERVAIFSALANGEREFLMLALTSDSEEITTPCGACRQVLVEFNPQLLVIMANVQGKSLELSAAELLPHSFKL